MNERLRIASGMWLDLTSQRAPKLYYNHNYPHVRVFMK